MILVPHSLKIHSILLPKKKPRKLRGVIILQQEGGDIQRGDARCHELDEFNSL